MVLQQIKPKNYGYLLRWKILPSTPLSFGCPAEGYHPPYCELSVWGLARNPWQKETNLPLLWWVAKLGYTYILTHWNLKIKWPIRSTGELNLIHEHKNEGQEASKNQRRKIIPYYLSEVMRKEVWLLERRSKYILTEVWGVNKWESKDDDELRFYYQVVFKQTSHWIINE